MSQWHLSHIVLLARMGIIYNALWSNNREKSYKIDVVYILHVIIWYSLKTYNSQSIFLFQDDYGTGNNRKAYILN